MLFATCTAFVILTITAAVWLLHQDRGTKEPLAALWLAFGFGLIALGLAVILERPLIPYLSGNLNLVMGFSLLSVAVIEEWAKFWLLAAYLYRRSFFNEHTDGIIYFGLCGLAFGLVENLGYTNFYGANAGIERLILIPIFHVVTASTVGYYLACAKLDGLKFWKVFAVWLVVVLAHAVYDICIYSGVQWLAIVAIIIVAGMGANLYRLLRRAQALDVATKIADDVQQATLMSAKG